MGYVHDIRFYRDEESGLAHCYAQHNIHEQEVIEVLRRPGRTFRNRDGTLAAEGQTVVGRCLRIIYRLNLDEDYIFVITAYDMKTKAKRAYRRRRHKRK